MFFRQNAINTAVVIEQTIEAFDWKLIAFICREVEFIETSLIAYPWYLTYAYSVETTCVMWPRLLLTTVESWSSGRHTFTVIVTAVLYQKDKRHAPSFLLGLTGVSQPILSWKEARKAYLLFTWRILEGSVPNISDDPSRISSKWHPRRGRICHVPNVLPSAPPRIQSIQRDPFGIKGPQLFNSLPIKPEFLLTSSRQCLTNSYAQFLISLWSRGSPGAEQSIQTV